LRTESQPLHFMLMLAAACFAASLACGSSKSSGGAVGTAGTGAAGVTGAAGSATGPGGTTGGAGAASGAGGVTGAAGVTTGAAGSTAGAAGTTTGAAGAIGAAGTTGAAGSTAGAGGATGDFSAGDGDFTIGPTYAPDPLNNPTSAPKGHLIHFQMMSSQSKIYPGVNGPFTRDLWAYVPQQYVAGTSAPYMVIQDGSDGTWFGNNPCSSQHPCNPPPPAGGIFPTTLAPGAPNMPGMANVPAILDNLIAAKMLPTIVVVFVEDGGGDAQGSERGHEYDTVSGLYAEFIQSEVMPRAIMEVQSQLNIALTLTSDPEGHGTIGGSSGGAAAFSMAWWHNDYFRKVITYSGTFIDQASPENPLYPHGCACYHDVDPANPAAPPNGLIMQATTNKPIRMWLESAQNDNQVGGGLYHDFRLASQRMAASFKAKGYHYHYDYAQGAGHDDGRVIAQTLAQALLWVWRGYPIN
jgi:enterochelin esterase-like enzyme